MGHKKTNTNKEQHHIKKQIKTLNSKTDPYKNWVNSRSSERLAFPASCTTPSMLFIINDMYIEYSGFHTNGFSQEDTHICFTHYNFAHYFQDIIYWTQPIKTSSLCGIFFFCFIIFMKNKNKICSLAASLFLSGKSEEQEISLVWPYI